ncbi:MAG: hypothetical protein KAH04_06005 [Psychrilyobacter sp.]|nr:hypothetical protein [Psychrilyobacter sp.]
MKKLFILFFIITTLTFSIPNFENLGWGFTVDAIKGYYPKLEEVFTTGQGVKKYEFYPKEGKFAKIIFYLFDNNLYKIVTEFDQSKVTSDDVSDIFNEYKEEWGTPERYKIDEEYTDYSVKGNEHTWINGTTYISFIGKDFFDKNMKMTDSKLLVEYGLIDPKKNDSPTSLNRLILDKK